MKTTWPFLLGLLLLPPPAVVQAQTYQTLDDPLAASTSGNGTFANGISGGNIVGYYKDLNGMAHGFFYSGTNYITLDDPLAASGSGNGTFGVGISGGNIVGYYKDINGMAHGFIYNGTNFSTLDDPLAASGPGIGTFATGISGRSIVGYFFDNSYNTHAFLYNGTAYVTLDVPNPLYGGAEALGISGSNIVGTYWDAGYRRHGFLYDGANYTTLDDPDAPGNTTAQGISGGNIVGNYSIDGFVYNGDTYTTLDDPKAGDAYDGISITGISGNTIVGTYEDPSGVNHGLTMPVPVADPHSGLTYTTNSDGDSISIIAPYFGTNSVVAVSAAINGLSVTAIGDYAFNDSSVTYVTIPGSVTRIGEYAFWDCGTLTGVAIPDSVTSIGDYAFYGCSGLTNATIPGGVTNIGVGPFAACSKLTEITVSPSNPTYTNDGGILFNRGETTLIQYPVGNSASSLIIPDSVTNVGDFAFNGCVNLISVTMGQGVRSIGDSAFSETGLYFITIGSDVTSIGESAFFASRLISVTIPNSVTTIGQGAFNLCEHLRSLTIGTNVASIGDYAFGYSALSDITLPASATNLGVDLFENDLLMAITVDTNNPAYSSVGGVLFNKQQTTLVQYPGGLGENYIIPAAVTNIARDAFIDCYGLKGVYFTRNAPSVDGSVFSGDNGITAYYLPVTTGWGANFDAIPTAVWSGVTYALGVSARPSVGGTVSAGGSFPAGSSQTVTATSNDGYTFANWSESGSVVGSAPNYSFTLTSNVNLVASFLANRGDYTLAVSASPTGDGNVSGGGLFAPNSSQTVAAAANNGYSFVNWTENGLAVSTSANYTFVLDQNLSLVAHFAAEIPGRFTVAVAASPIAGGKVTGGGAFKAGTSRIVTAIPAGLQYRFASWTENGSVVSDSPTYSFTLSTNRYLVANFVSNPFLPLGGSFNGLFLDTNNLTEANSGFFTLALTTSGTFTGKIMTSGSTYSLPTTTPFDARGQVQFTVPTKQKTLTFNLQLDLSDPASQQIGGTVSDGAWTAGLTADRAVFSASTNKAVNYEGQYTLAIAGSEDAAASPGGFGWATLSVSSAGLITMAGNLADGTAISQSVSVSKDGRWPFYAAYPAPPSGNGGAVAGWLTFSNQPASSLGGTLYWFRPARKTPTVYQSGFTNLGVSVIGSAYNPVTKPSLALTSGQVTLDGGNVPFAITNQITLSANDAITVAPGETNKLALTINKSTGVISGTFANPSNPKQTIKIYGVLLQDQTSAAGYFLEGDQSEAFLLEGP